MNINKMLEDAVSATQAGKYTHIDAPDEYSPITDLKPGDKVTRKQGFGDGEKVAKHGEIIIVYSVCVPPSTRERGEAVCREDFTALFVWKGLDETRLVEFTFDSRQFDRCSD